MVLKVIDLFAGVGGLSLGATRAGFDLVGAAELDSIAINTHKYNFPNLKHLQCDIAYLSGNELLEQFQIKEGELSGLIGGPPCQGFSNMGKQNINDIRNTLFIHFFRLVKEVKPDFFIAENVPGILNEKFDKIRNTAFDLITGKYKVLPHIVLKAQDYGVPTSRTRVFFIGYKKGKVNAFEPELFLSEKDCKIHYVHDALDGLPFIINNYDTPTKSDLSWCKIGKTAPGSYADLLSKVIPTGVGNKEAIERFINYSEVTGVIGTKHSSEVEKRYRNVPPGKTDIVSRSFRLQWDGFCPTLRAGTDSNHGSFQAVRPLHPIEGRVITPREAARLQGFPDWFVFHRTKWHSFRQIGNSVSPIIAENILKKVYQQIK